MFMEQRTIAQLGQSQQGSEKDSVIQIARIKSYERTNVLERMKTGWLKCRAGKTKKLRDKGMYSKANTMEKVMEWEGMGEKGSHLCCILHSSWILLVLESNKDEDEDEDGGGHKI